MNARATISILAILSAALVLSGCGSDTCGPGDPCGPGSFEVRVLTSEYEPVAGAWIDVGFDWTRCRVKTDSDGIAVVPNSARGRYAEIHKDNFYPVTVNPLEPGWYYLYPTPARLERIGTVAGRSVRFDPDRLFTLEYAGVYHAYSYDESAVTELASAEIEAGAIVDFEFAGDTLWLSTHDDGVYAYSLEDPLNPILLRHLDIDGYLGPIAVKDSTIAVGSWDAGQPVRVFSFTPGGEMSLVSTIQAYEVQQMEYRSHFLVMVSYGSLWLSRAATLRVVDMTDASSPRIAYSLVEQGARVGLILDHHVLLGPSITEETEFISYTTIFMDDPENPAYAGRTVSRVWLESVSDDSYAVGSYCMAFGDYPWCSQYGMQTGVAVGGIQSTFNAVAVLFDILPDRPGVHRPPFFVIGGALWRLEEQ